MLWHLVRPGQFAHPITAVRRFSAAISSVTTARGLRRIKGLARKMLASSRTG